MRTVCENPICLNYGKVANRPNGVPCGMCRKPVRQLNPAPLRVRRDSRSAFVKRIVAGAVIEI